ncbi:KAP family P-loop NTPase fold protein [Jeotgalibacillus proteolyticus]|uniref:KAP NTPase domain-containing protein n=1 Tax=Jeotgalibacillus proteolyticus TaxID=2082395 RepID=A0A2S5G644_9BACL|nr:P-loop NTPase fold protein [Jeotgalibacillus proteolyticus]PPA68435.1 hypothetical protein C4B60_20945 [Jeotgalibacillus proteolyticus]
MTIDKEQFFLKDTALMDKENDAFHHEDYVRNLKKIILEHDPPYNIALIGRWGVGKSSIINLLKKELDGKPEIVTHEINAWKYENDSLKKAFLKNLYRSFNPNKDVSMFTLFAESLRKVTGDITHETRPLSPSQTVKNFIPLLSSFFVVFLMSSLAVLLVLFAWAGINAIFSSNTFVSNATNAYTIFLENIWLAIIIVPLLKTFQDISKTAFQYNNSEVKLVKPIETADEYEDLFKREIENYKVTHPKFKKLVVIVDDLDRLTTKKVVSALDAIKAFVEINECIFIVTCDENILINALEKEKLNKSLDVDGELFLDKLFHFRISLPPIIERDMSEFAFEITKQEAPGLVRACNGQFDEITNILIHAGVSTPRQVKKLMNTFANNLLIARAREEDGRKLEDKLLTNNSGLKYLAKISVIQSDYNDVYLELVKDFNYLEDLLRFYQFEEDEIDDTLEINQSVKKFFNNKSSVYQIKPHFEGLMNFLSKTQHITVDNVAPFIYLGQDAIGLNAGDEKQRLITQSLTSGNEKAVIDMLQESKENIYLVHAIIEIIKQSSIKDLPSVLKASVHLINVIEEDKKEFANVISQRLNTTDLTKIRFWQMNLKNLVDIYRVADNDKGIELGLLTALRDLFSKTNWKNSSGKEMGDDEFITKINEVFTILFNVEEELSISIKEQMKNFLGNLNDEYNFYSFEYIHELYVSNISLFDNYFGIPFYSQLISDMENATDEQLSSEIDTFKEIAPKIREQDPILFIGSLPVVIDSMGKNEHTLSVLELLLPVIEDINADQASSIVEAVSYFTFDDNQINSAMKILRKIPFNLNGNESLVEHLDEFILKHISDQGIKSVNEMSNLINYALERNEMDFAIYQQSFNHFLENILSTSNNDWLLKDFSIYFSSKQRVALFNKINPVIQFSTYNPKLSERVFTLFSILINDENNASYIEGVMNKGITEFKQNRWNQNINWTNDFINLFTIASKVIEESDMSSFLSVLEGPVTQNGRTDLVITALRKIGEFVPPNKVVSLRTYCIDNAASDHSKLDAFDFLKTTNKYATKENENLSEYVSFLVTNFHLNIESFLSELHSRFSLIGKDKILHLLKTAAGLEKEKLELNLPIVNYTVEKFFMALENKEREGVLISVINGEFKINFIESILLDSLNSNLTTTLLNGVLTSKDIQNKESKMALLEICESTQNSNDKSSLTNLIIDMLKETEEDDDYIIKVCDVLINQYSTFRFNHEKKRVANQVVWTFRNVNNVAKERLLEVGKTFLLKDAFVEALKSKSLSDEEADMVEKYYKIRKKKNLF